jgi:hypothetical protein
LVPLAEILKASSTDVLNKIIFLNIGLNPIKHLPKMIMFYKKMLMIIGFNIPDSKYIISSIKDLSLFSISSSTFYILII